MISMFPDVSRGTTNVYAISSESFIKNPYIYHLPGITPETIETCSRLLQHNHEHYHIFFNSEHHFHNHATHYLLAALGLGASSHTLEHIYEQQKQVQQPIRPLHDNKDFDVNKCLGDENYYGNYLEFFKKELESEKYHGNVEDLIEDYLFNKDYLDLVFNGAYHPFIHLGYALEFQVKIMAVEGLAMAAVDRVNVKDVLKHLNYDQNKDGNKTALEIIELIIKDQRFDDKVFYNDDATKVDKLLERGGGPLIAEYAQMWKCDLDDLRQASVLVNTAVIRPKKALRLDFFLMHATTSGLFIDIFVHSLKKTENQFKFLKAKFAIDLLYYVARGRPKLNVNYLLNEYQSSKEHSYSDVQNPWLPLIDKCLTHQDTHVVKTIRALVYAEKFDSAQEKDKMSYLKIAQMVMDALFPADKKQWSHEGVGWEEYWKTVEDS
ncbi:unnamed protein product [Rotaria sordida]|uniref:Uncharacterized protein n=1 Tax=Rotaria sordida TaxID=392033 RepID=A0A815TW15_9BILA|nr:unnamed protein product [Rotaria sordida]